MIDAFRAAFQELIDASLLGDPQRFGPAVGQVYNLASQVPSSEREIALEALGPIFSGHHTGPGAEADLTVVAGAFVEMGTPPGATGIEVLRLVRETGKAAGVFLHAWDKTGGGPPPEPERVTAADEDRVAKALNESATMATMCWWTARRFGLSAKTMLSRAEIRAEIRADSSMHGDLLAIAGQLSAHLPEYGEISALLRMDEVNSALVLDRASSRAFRVGFEGIGDNFQLHTLLAAALIGDGGRGLAGEVPDPRWVSAFTDADPDPRARIVSGWWNLVAADGTWVWNEGVPADIPVLEGERILVLEEQTYPRSWNAGRLYPLVAAALWVQEELESEDARRWWSLIQPEERVEGFISDPDVSVFASPSSADSSPVGVSVFLPEPGDSSPPTPPWEKTWSDVAEEPAPHPVAEQEPAPEPQPEVWSAWSAPASARPQPDPAEAVPEPEPERAFAPAPEAAHDPEPVHVEPEVRPAPVSMAATEVFAAITDDDLNGPPPTARTSPAQQPEEDDAEQDKQNKDTPGASLLPPLPPGVSDSSGWGPSWL
ncbi:hypothetical protein [Nocardiopsis ansamitocini]|uniref:Uncharacterized protein n=1 Tax=Nocardiopsis ansamitocini TaxID=1670832 RepID=A0A9W6UJV1_9ACTN|nr:hypothetical protein [Nocardiopsis ansamitocini]GLU48440.1 hypothetical protein Nans01_27910 [Nocardiopsis ansamitocini]